MNGTDTVRPLNPSGECQRPGCGQAVKTTYLFCGACNGLTIADAVALAARIDDDTSYGRYLDAAGVA